MITGQSEDAAKQSLLLESHEVELNGIDCSVVAAARTGTTLPRAATIFGAMADASIASADVMDLYRAVPIPENIRAALMRLQCATTNLAASLKLYAALAPPEPYRQAQKRLLQSPHTRVSGNVASSSA